MESMSTFSVIFQFLKFFVEKYILLKISNSELRHGVQENLDSLIIFILLLPTKLLVIYIFLIGFGKLTNCNFIVGYIAQCSLFLVLISLAVVRFFMDRIFGTLEI